MTLSFTTLRKFGERLLGARGFPGNTIYHINSMFIPAHSKRVFVEGEVDMVSSVGYNPARRTPGVNFSRVDLRLIVTDGTGKKAEAPGFRVGGKTGSAEKPGAGGYRRHSLVSTFAAACRRALRARRRSPSGPTSTAVCRRLSSCPVTAPAPVRVRRRRRGGG